MNEFCKFTALRCVCLALAFAPALASAALLNGASTGGVYVKPSGNVFVSGIYSPTFATPELTYSYTGTDDGSTIIASGRSQVTSDSSGVYLHAQSALNATVQAPTPGAKRFAISIQAGFTDEITVYGTPNQTVFVYEYVFGDGSATGTGDAYVQGGFKTDGLGELYAGSKQCYFNVYAGSTHGACIAAASFAFDALGVYTFQAGVGIAPFSEATFGSFAGAGSTASGSVNFWNTAGISRFAFADTAGNPLSLRYSTASGATYGVASVPEPASYALMLAGLACLVATARRSDKRLPLTWARRSRMKASRFAVALLTMLAAGSVSSAPVIVRTDFFTDVIGANALFGRAAGNYLHLDTTATSTFVPASVSAQATYSLDASIIRTLNFYTAPIFAEKNFDRFLTDTSRTGAWDLAVTDPSGTATGVFSAIAAPEFLPLVLNLHLIANGTTPTLAWDLPDLTGFDVDRIHVRAADADTGIPFFQSIGLSPLTTSFVMPAGFLQLGKGYEFRVILEDLEGGKLENRSNTFSGVVRIPEPGTVALLGFGLMGLAATRRRWSLERPPRQLGA